MDPVGKHHRSRAGAAKSRPSIELADIFRQHGEGWRATHAATGEQRRVMKHIETCRTKSLGGHLDVCTGCGFSRPSYNSCRDRHCPKCQSTQQAKWVDARQARILNVPHFHVVFTVPSELRPLARSNPRSFYDLLFDTVRATLLQLSRDKKWLGAMPGITAVLHTWTRKLEIHPHLHCIVTGGGLNEEGRWRSASEKFLFPVKVLGEIFRGKMVSEIEKEWKSGSFRVDSIRSVTDFARLRQKLYSKPWVVYAKQPFAGSEHLFQYLGRYTHRVALSNQRLISVDEKTVQFVTRGDSTAVLPVDEFISRFLSHLLPKGFVKIRHYGLYSAGNVRTKLEQARAVAPSTPSGSAAPLRRYELIGALTALALPPSFIQRVRVAILIGRDPLECPSCQAVLQSRPLQPPDASDTS